MRGGRIMRRWTGAGFALLLAGLVAAPALGQGSVREAHRAADRNGDGVLDRQEFHQRMVDVFYLQDANKDGRLAPAELPGLEAKAFARADANGDGSLDLGEFLNARARDFAAADKNGDGGLSAEEAAAYK